MIEGLLYEGSRTAGTAMVLLGLSCLCTGLIAILAMHMPGDTRSEGAYRLTRIMAVAGGAFGLVAALTGVPYHWLVGDISQDMFLAVEGGLLLVVALFAVVSAALLPHGKTRSR
ncbi:MAG TPA: hypothetical protein VNS99_13695 [Gaiellales bacterium]|nr:hypothetical protein [Gaiellales bacterium]